MKICVLIPTYNESNNVANLICSVKKLGFDVLVVDDGSIDNTVDIAKGQGAIVLANKKNEGKGLVLRNGFKYILSHDYDAVIIMDGDGQHSPDDINNFIQKIENTDYDMLIGNRMDDVKSMPKIRIFINRLMSYVISKLSHQVIDDSQSGFRFIKRKVLENIELTTSNYEIESEMIIDASRKGFKIGSVPIKTIYVGQLSRISPVTDTFRFARFIIGAIFKRR